LKKIERPGFAQFRAIFCAASISVSTMTRHERYSRRLISTKVDVFTGNNAVNSREYCDFEFSQNGMQY
jgi:hypothetical protein